MQPLSEADRAMLLELTALPTAAGREWRVVSYVTGWCAEREDVVCTPDPSGNLVIERRGAPTHTDVAPLYITAHMDHPAFVVQSVEDDGATLRLEFRGGVKDPYFKNAPIAAYTREDQPVFATLTQAGEADPYRACVARVHDDQRARAKDLLPGDVARWRLPDPTIEPIRIDGEDVGDALWTHACDDLAALAAALVAFDRLRDHPEAAHVRLLLTRAEEVGFIGAIGACKAGTMPGNARVVLLENSRASAFAPIGDGPIVRVGDRMSTFHPVLTSAFADLARALENEARERQDETPFRWQRKLMTGGACEASCYQAYGYEAACLCLPLGNYHNMSELDRVEDEEPEALEHARCGPEHVAIFDWLGMVELLVGAGTRLNEPTPMLDKLEKLFGERSAILTP
ncbi:MAG: hypothetical protein Tsb0013_11500 [Phycisphaerales bacterium]